MKSMKIVSFFAGISMLAATLVPSSVSAAAANMTLAGATQTNGTFSTIVYENSDGPVTSVSLAMTFSQPVSNVSYDYSVGPFTTTDPSGGHLAQGSVTGSQPVARVSFTLANPGTVNASVNTASSYLKGANGTTVVHYALSSETSSFTYNAPAQGGRGGEGSNGGASTGSTSNQRLATTGGTGSTTPVADTNATTAAPEETKKTQGATDTKENKQTQNDSSAQKGEDNKENTNGKRSVWPWVILLLIAATAAVYVYRKRDAEASAKEENGEDEPKTTKKPAPAAEEAVAPVVAKAKSATGKSAQGNQPRGGKKSGKRSSSKRNR